MKRRTAIVALLASGVAPAVGAFDVAATIAPRKLELRPGETRELVLEVVVKPGYHVQANPAALPFLIPTVLTFEPAAGLVVGAARYPAPKRLRLVGSDQDLLVYDGRFTIAVTVTQPAGGAAAARLDASLRYQGCDDRRCYPPRTRSITVLVATPRQAAPAPTSGAGSSR